MKLVSLIADLHLGNNKDNPKFHKIALDYADWVKGNMDKAKCKTLIIAGDFFHNRTHITLTTLQVGHLFLEKFQDCEIYIIAGNHDSLYNDNPSINSLTPFKHRKNVHIVDKMETLDNITMCPWGTSVADITPNDVVIGHWDAVSFEVAGGKISTHGIKVADLMDRCKLGFSGHYHKPQQRKYGNKTFRYLGSTFQLNWGEANEIKYQYLVDLDALKTYKIENTVSPKFKRIKSTKELDEIDNNFVSCEIEDVESAESTISLLMSKGAIDVVPVYKELDYKKNVDDDTEETIESKDIDFMECLNIYLEERTTLSKEDKEAVTSKIKNMMHLIT